MDRHCYSDWQCEASADNHEEALEVNSEEDSSCCVGQWFIILGARNWELFKGQTMHIERAITQINKELIDRLSIPQLQKKLDRSRGIKQRIYM